MTGPKPDGAPTAPQQTLADALRDVLAGWDRADADVPADPGVLERADLLLDAATALAGTDEAAGLRAAAHAGDPRAHATLARIERVLGSVLQGMVERAVGERHGQAWTALRDDAGFVVALARALGRGREQVVGLVLLAQARRAHRDLAGTIAAYQEAVALADPQRDVDLLGAAYDNLGLVLDEADQVDEALACFTVALAVERDPAARRVVLANRARTLASLGEHRSAARDLQREVAELEAAGVTGAQLAVALDNAAQPLVGMGELEPARELLERARLLFPADDLRGRAVNASSRSTLYTARGDRAAAAEAFEEAHELALADARAAVDVEHYRQGLRTALGNQISSDSDVARAFTAAVLARQRGDLGEAQRLWPEVAQRADAAGDAFTALRAAANLVATLLDAGRTSEGLPLAQRIRSEAATRGFARPELMVLGSLASLAAGGADIRESLGALQPLVQTIALSEVLAELVLSEGLSAEQAAFQMQDSGVLDSLLAAQFRQHHAYGRAAHLYRRAADRARELGLPFELVNRLSGLRACAAEADDRASADTAARELADLVARGGLPDRALVVAHGSLGFHLRERDPDGAVHHLSEAVAAVERMRSSATPGEARADISVRHGDVYRLLASLLRRRGDGSGAFSAVQGSRGRRLVDVLAAREPAGPPRDQLLGAAEVGALLTRMDPGTTLVDLSVDQDGVTAYVVGPSGVQVAHRPGDLAWLDGVYRGDERDREDRLVQASRAEVLQALIGDVERVLPPIGRVLVVPDSPLENLPLHTVPLDGGHWCDRRAIAQLPTAGLLRFAPLRRSWLGRSLVAGDSREDLPFAGLECREAATALGTTPLLGRQCTRAALEEALTGGAFDVVHLAVHGRGDARRGGRASILVADGRGGVEWLPFDDLIELPWRAELVVLSGCSTGVAGPRHGQEMLGVARAALEAGAAAVISCLWPVGDEAAAVFMRRFYAQLVQRRTAGPVDLRLVMDEARDALRTWLAGSRSEVMVRRDARHVAPAFGGAADPVDGGSPASRDPTLVWGPFVLSGDPVLGD